MIDNDMTTVLPLHALTRGDVFADVDADNWTRVSLVLRDRGNLLLVTNRGVMRFADTTIEVRVR